MVTAPVCAGHRRLASAAGRTPSVSAVGFLRTLGTAGGVEVLGGDLVEELAEALDLVVLVLGDDDAGLVDDRVLDADRLRG